MRRDSRIMRLIKEFTDALPGAEHDSRDVRLQQDPQQRKLPALYAKIDQQYDSGVGCATSSPNTRCLFADKIDSLDYGVPVLAGLSAKASSDLHW
jgi:hypothetical protein